MANKLNKTENSILSGIQEAIEFAKGDKDKAITYSVEVKDIDVKELRESLQLSQNEFAKTFGVSLATIRNWEQGRRHPEGPAKVLLNVIAKNPKTVFEAIRA